MVFFILERVIVELSRSPSWVAGDRMYTTTRNLLIASGQKRGGFEGRNACGKQVPRTQLPNSGRKYNDIQFAGNNLYVARDS
jgi:hypothetical protein